MCEIDTSALPRHILFIESASSEIFFTKTQDADIIDNQQTCPTVAYQLSSVCVPVTVTPFATAGATVTRCCKKPVVTAGKYTCNGASADDICPDCLINDATEVVSGVTGDLNLPSDGTLG